MVSVLLRLQEPAGGGVTFIDFTKDQDPSLAWLILSTFGLIALVLALTVGLGLVIGFLRIWFMNRFPHNRFNGRDGESTIRLHLKDEPGGAPHRP